MLAKLFIVVAGAVCTVVASAVVQRDGFRPLNPPLNILESRDDPSYKPLNPPLDILVSRDAPSPTLVRMTNAERLIAGLPLNPPRRSRTGQLLALQFFFSCQLSLMMK